MALAAFMSKFSSTLQDIVHEVTCTIFHQDHNQNTWKTFIEPSVQRHIRVLQEDALLPLEERSRLYYFLFGEYTQHYCPPHFMYDWLNKENRERYFWLRVEIDEALEPTSA